ncbi:unnamed protein product [Brassica oleracea var. botrytis]|uniref:Secreted protein n=1 Tax=Brassica oleracea TaxID=3712 RepID=A0A3P6BD22_BRAOL|nr:unnamed protein product [Brassica oleracea]
MTSLLLLRTLPLLFNGFLSHRHQVNIAAVWFLSHRHQHSLLLLRTLPLLCNGFLSQCHQVNIAAVWFLSHRYRAEKPQLHKDNSPGESCATAAINSTPSIGDN